MQYTNPNPPLLQLCTTPNGAADNTPVLIIGGALDNTSSSWYRELSDGTIIQGGFFFVSSTSSNKMLPVSFNKPYTNDFVNVKVTPLFSTTKPGNITGGFLVGNITSSDFSLITNGSASRVIGCSWEATGR